MTLTPSFHSLNSVFFEITPIQKKKKKKFLDNLKNFGGEFSFAQLCLFFFAPTVSVVFCYLC